MKIKDIMYSISERVYITVFILLFISASLYAYLLKGDSILLEQKIALKQKELDTIIKLKESYLAKKKASETVAPGDTGKKKLSLKTIEDIVTASFISGRINNLKPAASKEDKTQTLVELKVSSSTLGEVVSFAKAVETAGLRLKKLQLTMPGGQPLIDISAIITEG